MNIKRESIGALNETLTIQLIPSDYQDKVEKALKDQSKKAKLPGFRPGMVPSSHLKKIYGKNILMDEVNRLMRDSLGQFITENKIEILGNPIPYDDHNPHLNWEEEGDFEFKFEIGIAPQINVGQLPTATIKAYTILVDSSTLDSRMMNLRRAYGKMMNPDKAEAGDVLFLNLIELDSQGEIKEGGIQKKASIRLDQIGDEIILTQLIGLRKGDKGIIHLLKAFNQDPHPLGHVLDITTEEAQKVDSNFTYETLNINRLIPAELDTDFFEKLFPDGSVQDELGFREYVRLDLEGRMRELSDQRLNPDIIQVLIRHFTSVLPHQFLRKWLLSRGEDQYTEENLGTTYPNFEKNLKWTLISNQLAVDHSIEVEPKEIVEEARQKLKLQFKMYSPEPIGEEELNEYSMKILQNRDQVSMLAEEIKARKVLDYLRKNLNIEYSEIGYEAFMGME